MVLGDGEEGGGGGACAPSSSGAMQHDAADEEQLMSVKLPTCTSRANKRKHIKTNFDEANLSSLTQEAQRRERERLQRLEKLREESNVVNGACKETVSNGVTLEDPSSEVIVVEDDGKPPVDILRRETKGKAPPDETDVILLSSGDDSDNEAKPDKSVWPVPRPAFYRHVPGLMQEDETERLHREERERLRKRRHSEELESTELLEGRLLVNAGKPPGDPDVYVPKHLTDVLQPHQLGGIRFMYDNVIETVSGFEKSTGFGCILAHSMGLGKTIQVIAFTDIFVRSTNAKKVLIIVPINTILNWYSEYDRWLPDTLADDGTSIRPFSVFLFGDNIKMAEQRVELLEKWHTEGGVLLMGYDMFRLLVHIQPIKKPNKKRSKVTKKAQDEIVDLEKEEIEITNRKAARRALIDPGPDLVVCDEGHRIKNDKTGIAASLGAIKTRRRIVLTGYPLQNNLMEYFCMVDFVRPSYLGTKKEFKNMFERPIKNGICIDSTPADMKLARQRTHVLVEMLKGFVQRRTHHLLKTILPPSLEYVILLRKSPIQRVLYRAFLQYAQSEITSSGNSVFNPLRAFAACSKIWNHPDILYYVLEKQKENAEKEKCIARGSAQSDISMCGEEQQCSLNANTYAQESTFQPTAMSPEAQPCFASGNNADVTCGRTYTPSQYNMQSTSNSPFCGTALISNCRPAFHNPSLPFSSSLFFNGLTSLPQVGSSASMSTLAESDSPDSSLLNAPKRKHSSWSANKTIARALLEEMGFDKGVNYDWAALAMGDYRTDVVENGYKMVISLDIIKRATEIGDKVLLFSQSLLTLNLIERYLEKFSKVCTANEEKPWKRNRTYLRFDGSTPATEREKLINRFNDDPNVLLFLISTRAGSLGINLVAANRVIIFDTSWNPCHDAQAVCRIFRYGQKKQTFIYRLVMDNSMERGIFNRQIGKSGLQQRVVDDRQLDVDVTKSELTQLLIYDESLDVFTENEDVTTWHMDDGILWLTALAHAHMFSQEPFLHDSLLMEREEGLSAEEKAEAQLLYEREKNMYRGLEFDSTLEKGPSDRDFSRYRTPLDRMWYYTPSLAQGPLPLRATPFAMGLERVADDKWLLTPERAMLVRAHNELVARGYAPQTPLALGPSQQGQVNHPPSVLRRAVCRPTAPGEVIDLCDSD
ncbi:Helicase ARIP4 [Toxocara canis]|uniref:Helicase ARIP4 n=1 Tax=Toxocara canis TaxID=6265 RepID=A0A0B2UQS4_TOXCA|nr:Helicase ARIP4 [Toxocara canis]